MATITKTTAPITVITIIAHSGNTDEPAPTNQYYYTSILNYLQLNR